MVKKIQFMNSSKTSINRVCTPDFVATVFPHQQEITTSRKSFASRLSIIRDFALNTSTHAIPGIARSQNKYNRTFWALSFIGFTVVMSYFLVDSIITYFQYPTNTAVAVLIERSQPFPAVTICNYSPARLDLTIELFLNYTSSRNLSFAVSLTQLTEEQSRNLRDYLVSMINSGIPIKHALFSLDIMLMSCIYNGINCSTADFISFTSPRFGLCYIFNAKTKSLATNSVRKTNDNGAWGRLQLKLYAHSHLYVPYLSDDVSVGMVTMVHDNGEIPLIDVSGLYLSTKKRHKLTYKRKYNYYMPPPYTDCTTTIPPPMEMTFEKFEGADFIYSQGICNIICSQTYIYQQCGCVNPDLWAARHVKLPGTNIVIEAPLCIPSSSCYRNASVQLSASDTLWSQFCSECKPACSSVDFTVTTSAVDTIAYTSVLSVKNFVESTGVPLPMNWNQNWMTEINNNYFSLEVVSESNMIENYTQTAVVTPTDLLSNVGGQTGLWIGISFLSIMELVEMLYRLIWFQWRRYRRLKVQTRGY